MDPELNKYLKWLVKAAILLIVLAASYFIIAYLLPLVGRGLLMLPILILPFLFAFLLAVIVEPLVYLFETRFRLNRNLAAGLSLAITVGGVVYFFFIIISTVIKDLAKLIPRLAVYSDQAIAGFMDAVSGMQLFFLQYNMSDNIQQIIQDSLQHTAGSFTGIVNNSIQILTTSLSALPGFFVFLMITAVATYLIVIDRYAIRRFVMDFIPQTAKPQTSSILSQLVHVLFGFLKAYSILISITAAVTMIGLKMIGLDYILTIGIIVGLLDMLPILGPGAFFIPWILWEFVMGNPKLGISLLVLYVTISLIRQFLEPKIVGDNIGLHPLATLMSLYIGMRLGGIVGLIAGPVILVILVASYRAGLLDKLDWRKKY